MSKAKMNGAGKLGVEKQEQWLVRMPGGPMRVIRSNRALTENRVKDIYTDQLNFRSSKSNDDPDIPWPALKQISDEDITNNYGWLLEESRRKNFRGVIKVVDGVVVEDIKGLPERKHVNTKVDVKLK